MEKENSQFTNSIINERYNNLKKELATPTSVLQSQLRTSAKLLQEKICALNEDAGEVFKIQYNPPISAEHICEVADKVSALLEKHTSLQNNLIGKNQTYISRSAAEIEEVFRDFKKNVSILTLKNNLKDSGIDIKKL